MGCIAFGMVAGRALVISGSSNGTVRSGTSRAADRSEGDLDDHEGGVTCVAFGRVAGRDLVVSAGSDNTLRFRDPLTGERVGPVIEGPTKDWETTAAFASIGGRDVLVTGAMNGEVHIWDPIAGRLIYPPVKAHGMDVTAATIIGTSGSEVIVSASGIEPRRPESGI